MRRGLNYSLSRLKTKRSKQMKDQQPKQAEATPLLSEYLHHVLFPLHKHPKLFGKRHLLLALLFMG